MSGTASGDGTPLDDDVLVVGTGPAGAVAAMLLAAAGVAVAVEPERIEGHRRANVGETLPPPARLTFARLGLEALLADAAHVASPGTVSSWGGEVRIADFLFSPYGAGVHLDRRRF